MDKSQITVAIKQSPPLPVTQLFQLLPEAMTSPVKYRHPVKARVVFLLGDPAVSGECNGPWEKVGAIAACSEHLSQGGERLVKKVGIQLVER
jgi:hypothetical protein